MDPGELGLVALGALRGHRLRSFLSMLGIAIGIAAVVLLTSIGEGTRRFLISEFTQFGTNIMAINPGKTETVGIPGIFGGTTHKLTIDDAEAVERLPGIMKVVPVAMGQARVEGNARGRSVFIYGVTSDVPDVWKFEVGQGAFLPPGDPRRGTNMTVLGPKLKRELFGEENALGRFVRIAGFRLRVTGVMAPKGPKQCLNSGGDYFLRKLLSFRFQCHLAVEVDQDTCVGRIRAANLYLVHAHYLFGLSKIFVEISGERRNHLWQIIASKVDRFWGLYVSHG